jgi:hypothetical protein
VAFFTVESTAMLVAISFVLVVILALLSVPEADLTDMALAEVQPHYLQALSEWHLGPLAFSGVPLTAHTCLTGVFIA